MGWVDRLNEPLPIVIGHRGACGLWPENTRVGFEAAWRLGAEAVEFDVRFSRDGVPVVLHDATLDRVAGVPLTASDTDWSRLRVLEVGAWKGESFRGERLLRLEEVLEAWPDRLLNIELKDDAEPHKAALLSLLDSYPGRDNLLVSSFHPANLRLLAHEAPAIARAFLFERPLDALILAFGSENRCLSLNGWIDRLDAAQVALARQHGFPVLIFTVNEKAHMAEALGWGARGLFTNYPDRLREMVDGIR